MSSCGSNAGTETSTPLIIAFVNNAQLHLNSCINQMSPGSNHSHPPLFSDRLLSQSL